MAEEETEWEKGKNRQHEDGSLNKCLFLCFVPCRSLRRAAACAKQLRDVWPRVCPVVNGRFSPRCKGEVLARKRSQTSFFVSVLTCGCPVRWALSFMSAFTTSLTSSVCFLWLFYPLFLGKGLKHSQTGCKVFVNIHFLALELLDLGLAFGPFLT